jgi:hypothetical protein
MPLSKRYVAVGDSTEVGIGLRISSRPRAVKRSPRVKTSDPNNSDIVIRLEAQVVESFDSTAPITIHPQRIYIPRENRDGEYWLIVRNVSDESIEPRIISQQPGALKIELPEDGIAPGEEEKIVVRVDEDFTKVTHKTSFTMEMSDDDKTRFTVPVELGTTGQLASRPKAKSPKPSTASRSDKQIIRPTASNKDKGGGK